jgi:hypothetical protein
MTGSRILTKIKKSMPQRLRSYVAGKMKKKKKKKNQIQGIQRYTTRQPMLEYTFA